MSHFRLCLLGRYYPTLDDEPVSGFSSAKVRGLLAYLAVESGRPHSRESLAGLLWPEEPGERAHTNLRQALANLRRVLDEQAAQSPLLATSRTSIQFDQAGDSFVDVTAFYGLLAQCRTHAHRRREACPTCAAHLQQAVDLYQGDFLIDLFVNDSTAFEEWALGRREELRRLALDALLRLAAYYTDREDYERGRHYAARLLELEPWSEEAYRQMMRAYAFDGQRSAALAQYERCRRMMAAELGAEPSRETVDLLHQIEAGTLAEGRSLAGRHWPVPGTPFVGRQLEQTQILARLQMPTTRLVSLIGLGGAGKTRLALRVAEQVAPEFRDGACFVPLAGIRGAVPVSHAIAVALGITLANRADPVAELAGLLRRRDLLLLLDNCEARGQEAELLDRLLVACPTLAVLATARERLNLGAEWVFEVDGLATPGRDSASGAGESDAVRLFFQRMQQVSGASAATEQDRQAAERICELVEGLPLAIEIAASWTRVMPCAEVAAEIERNLGFLARDDGRHEGGQRSLGAILEQAWALLPGREQHIFRQLGVFRGGFRRADASEIVSAGPEGDRLIIAPIDGAAPFERGAAGGRTRPEDRAGAEVKARALAPRRAERGDQARSVGGEALDAALGLLVDRSLLRRTASGRYRLHPLVHQLALGKLAEEPELKAAVEARHAANYARLLAGSAEALKGAGQQTALAGLDVEYANLQAVWEWALAARSYPVIGLCLDGLDSFYDLHSWSQEATAAFEEAIAALEQDEPAADPGAAGDRLRVLGAVMARLGMHYYRLNRLEQAKALCERSLSLLNRVDSGGPAGEMAVALNGLGNVLFWQGDSVEAARCYAAGLELAQAAGDRWRMAALTGLRADCASIVGDHRRAMDGYEESLFLFRELGDPRMISVALSNLADGYRRQGCAVDARPLYLESLQIAGQIGHRRLVANNLNGLAELAYDQGNLRDAATNYQASLEICREIGSRTLANLNLAGLGNTASAEGDLRAARRRLAEALRDVLEGQTWAALPIVMIGAAGILAAGELADKERAAGLLMRILCQQITWEEYRVRAERLLGDLASELPASAYARASADAEPVEDTIRAVLGIRLPPDATLHARAGCDQR